MKIKIDEKGNLRMIYNEDIDLSNLGQMAIKRASYVEPEDDNKWSVDLSPVHGKKLFGFESRSKALEAEVKYVESVL